MMYGIWKHEVIIYGKHWPNSNLKMDLWKVRITRREISKKLLHEFKQETEQWQNVEGISVYVCTKTQVLTVSHSSITFTRGMK